MNRVVRTTMAEGEFKCLCVYREAQELMPEADAEHRHISEFRVIQQFTQGEDRRLNRFWISRSV